MCEGIHTIHNSCFNYVNKVGEFVAIRGETQISKITKNLEGHCLFISHKIIQENCSRPYRRKGRKAIFSAGIIDKRIIFNPINSTIQMARCLDELLTSFSVAVIGNQKRLAKKISDSIEGLWRVAKVRMAQAIMCRLINTTRHF